MLESYGKCWRGLESVGKLWNVLERVGKCWKMVKSGDLMIFMKAPVARTRLDGEARLELRWKDHQFDIFDTQH